MEKAILNYSPTVMFRGTPCRKIDVTAMQYLLVQNRQQTQD